MPSFSLLPSRYRRPRTAAVDVMDGSGIGPIPQSVVYTAEQQRAAKYVRRIGFVRRSYEFVAWQAARCTLRPEVRRGIDWEPLQSPLAQPLVWGALDTFAGRRSEQADLIRTGVFLDDTVGECFFILESMAPPSWTVRAPAAVTPKKGRDESGRQVDGFLVLDAPGGTVEKGTARWYPKSRVYRHWQPSPDYELLATSSLMGLLDDLDTYWTLSRNVRRTARSQLAAAGFVWTPAEAHVEMSEHNPKVSKLEYGWANAAAQALNDEDDMNVASVASFLMSTPGNIPPPQHIAVPGLTAEMLTHLQDARTVVADGLPLSTSSVIQSEEGNHWNEWLASEEDIELIGERLTRFCASLTRAVLRPTLQALLDNGVWDGDPESFRIGYDADPIRRRPDNSANAIKAVELCAIGWDALRRELHFSEDDAPTEEEVRQMLTIQALRTGRTPGFGSDQPAPVAVTQAPPPNALPPVPAAPGEEDITAAAAPILPVIDDRWLLTRASD